MINEITNNAENAEHSSIRLTQYSHGAGCGCKLSPAVLDRILHTNEAGAEYPRLIVGNSTRDDAAVYDLGDGRGLISTTDFFMPIVDDPYDFGRIASANAISDVYAMGGTPVMAIAILGWTVDKLAPEIASQVIRGSRAVCAEAGIPLAGGHSIDSPEPIFGLAVNGLVDLSRLKQNSTATEGSRLYLTKGLGVGILTTAEKNGTLKPEHYGVATASMTRINSIGAALAQIDGVTAMTDVTGFGLLGHLLEMCTGSGVSAEISFESLPRIAQLDDYISARCTPGGTKRNWLSYGSGLNMSQTLSLAEQFDEHYSTLALLCDPQTSGGLLVAVQEESAAAVEECLHAHGLGAFAQPVGRIVRKEHAPVRVI
jgi:selenide,water dikinase